MEEHPKEVKIFKDGELVATASHVRQVNVPMPWKPVHGEDNPLATDEPTVWQCFHLPSIKLERMFIFRILNKQPLSEIFNDAGVELDGERIEPVYYIHGMVETFRGNPNITAVALGKPNHPVDIKQFVSRLPELYRRFSALL
ncbi:MAG: hypothetical protein ACYTAO_02105 [Planctomycetota bacterium]|jgi:hypothetical protein